MQIQPAKLPTSALFHAPVAIITLLLLTMLLPAKGQQSLRLNHYTIDDGLSQNMTQCLVRDWQGFLWIGTKDGLNRFDGYTFKTYRQDPNNPYSLTGNNIRTLFQSSDSLLWIGLNQGDLNVFNRKQDRFYRIPEINEGITNSNVQAIEEDIHGNMWIATPYTIFAVRRLGTARSDSFQYEVYEFLTGKMGSFEVFKALDIEASNDGWIYVSSNKGLFKARTSAENLEDINFRKVWDKACLSVEEDQSGNIWVGAKGLYLYNQRADSMAPFIPPGLLDYYCSNIELVGSNTLWMNAWNMGDARLDVEALDNRLVVFNTDHTSFKDFDSPADLGYRYTCIYNARDGNVWLGTPGHGLYQFVQKTDQFTTHHYDFPRISRTVESNGFISRGTFIKNRFWTLIENPANHQYHAYNWHTKEVIPLAEMREHLRNWNMPAMRSMVQARYPTYMDLRGHFWTSPSSTHIQEIGSDGYQLNSYRITGEAQRHVPYVDPDGNIWTSTKGTIIQFDRENGLFQEHVITPGIEEGYTPYHSVFLRDDNGILWIGSIDGIMSYNPINKSTTRYYSEGSPHNVNILSLWDDASTQSIWAGTEGGGLIKLNKSTGSIKQYNIDDGLPNPVVYAVIPDDEGYLWLPTNRGLARFEPVSETFVVFTKEDGLPTNEFNRFFYSLLPDGSILLNGIGGITHFQPSKVQLDPTAPPITFTGFQVFNKPMSFGDSASIFNQPIEYTKSIQLPWHQNALTFEFAAMDFSAPHQVQYSYKMEGIDHDWTSPSSNRSATYANLAAGDYTFKVRAANSDGTWNDTGVALGVTITPPWWRTTAAYLFYGLALVLLVVAIFRFRLNRLRLKDALIQEQREAHRLQELAEMKSRFFSNITHEFRTPLTLISSPVERALQKVTDHDLKADLELVHRNSNQLLRLINQLLDMNKLESGLMSVKTKHADVISFVRNVTHAFQDQAQAKSLDLVFQSSQQAYEIDFDSDKLEQILYNLIYNAIKFTPEGGSVKVDVDVVNSPKSILRVQIIDTGVGIPPTQLDKIFDRFYQIEKNQQKENPGTGIGLSLVKELVLLQGGKINVNSTEGEGTAFSLEIPIRKIQSSEIIHDTKGSTSSNEWIESTFIDSSKAADKPIVLIIEDNADLRAYIKRCLKDEYVVLVATDGEEGLASAFEHIPDLVLSDVMMPKKDGIEVANTLKNDERSSHIPIILLTAKTALESRLEGLRTGADAYVSKPFSAEELTLRVEKLIEGRKKLQERYSQQLDHLQTEEQEDHFILKVKSAIERHLGDQGLSVEKLSAEMHLSRAQLHRKLKALTGQSATYFIKRIRMEQARKLILKNELSITEIAYKVGYNTVHYFSKSYKDYYGHSPSEAITQ